MFAKISIAPLIFFVTLIGKCFYFASIVSFPITIICHLAANVKSRSTSSFRSLVFQTVILAFQCCVMLQLWEGKRNANWKWEGFFLQFFQYSVIATYNFSIFLLSFLIPLFSALNQISFNVNYSFFSKWFDSLSFSSSFFFF